MTSSYFRSWPHSPSCSHLGRIPALRIASWALTMLCLMQAASLGATTRQVDEAVSRAVRYLWAQSKDGMWETTAPPDFKSLGDNGGFSEASKWGGLTAISAYALLAAGESPKTPEMQRTIKWLMAADMRGTYAVALRSQVWPLIPASKERTSARERDAQFLLSSVISTGPNAGFYGYSYQPSIAGQSSSGVKNLTAANWWHDRSNSQYGVLGVWAVEQAGAEIPGKYWEIVDKAWKQVQDKDGGWNYSSTDLKDARLISATMTAAGVATLFITQDHLLTGMKWDPCTGGVPDDHIDQGMIWMDKHVGELLSGNNYYGMYGIERIGVASGRKFIGNIDWYQAGADLLLQKQAPDGSWKGGWGDVPDTCFALLFLTRGRAPVMLNKLQYADKKHEDLWNERPRDAANLARWMGGRTETFLNWQVVNLGASADSLHDAPILYISGSDALDLPGGEVDKLRAFVEQGGIILGNADCGSGKFSRSFVKLGNQLFPRYEFRRLPTNHPIYTNEQFLAAKWKTHPKLEGLSNGVRELILLAPDADVSRAWQTDSTRTKEELFQLAANIYLYSVDKKNLHYKGDTYVVVPDGSPTSAHLKVARIQIDGNWDPEPGGWRRLAAIFHNQRQTALDIDSVKLGEGKLAQYKIASLTGTGKFSLSDAARGEIRRFVEAGGTLIVDAAGGSTQFADAAEAELNATFGKPNELSAPLPVTHALFSAGKRIDAVEYRMFSRHLIADLRNPRLRGITIGGRTAVFFSREDLSAGLVGQPVDGICGYEPQTATDLMTSILLYAQNLAAATAASDKTGKETTLP